MSRSLYLLWAGSEKPTNFLQMSGVVIWKNHGSKPLSAERLFSYSEKLFSAEIWKMPGCHFWANVMLKRPHVRASRSKVTRFEGGLFKKLFKVYIFCFLVHSDWQYLFIFSWNKFDEKRSVSSNTQLNLVSFFTERTLCTEDNLFTIIIVPCCYGSRQG